MKKILTLIVAVMLLTACGYRPSSVMAKRVIGERIYTNVDVSLSDPENAVLTKDAINRALQTRLQTIVTNKEDAESMIGLVYERISFIPLQYDRNGYVVFYQVQMTLKFTFIKGKESEERRIIGRYEFPILPSAIISNNVRLKAIEQSSIKAIDQFIAYISAKGFLLDDQ